MTKRAKNRIAGASGGLINGLFGGGGGMVVLPLLTGWSGLEARRAFPTCVAAIFPMCCVSAAVALWTVRPGFGLVWPYLAGGALGGLLGGVSYEKVPVRLLKAVFGAFLLYGGARYLLW